MIYKKLKKNILANSFVDFPQTSVGEDLLRIERKADINTNEITKTNNNVATNTQAIELINQELDTCAKLGEDNTFSGNNTFENPLVVGEPIEDNEATTKSYVDTQLATTIRTTADNNFTGNNTFKQIKVKGTNNNNNYVLLDNFDWQNKNYSAIKLVKDNNKNLLQLEAVNDDSSVAISAPGATSFSINNLSNPTQANQAANKQYVDNVIKRLTINLSQMGKIEDYSSGNMRFVLYNYNLMGNNQINYDRVVGVSFVNKGDRRIITGYCVYDNGWIEVQFLNTNSPTSWAPSGHIYVWYK